MSPLCCSVANETSESASVDLHVRLFCRGCLTGILLYKRVVFGKLINSDLKSMMDLDRSEYFILTCLAIPTLYFGFYPDPLINTIEVSVNDLIDMYNRNLIIK